MILRGILDRSLNNTVCVRGFASLGDLEKISRPDSSFQRDLIKKQKARIKSFLKNKRYLFFPEVILSYTINYDFGKKGAKSGLNPIQGILYGRSFESNVDKIKFQTVTKKFTGHEDSRGSDDFKYVTIYIDDEFIRQRLDKKDQPFLRIDGNHRLSAAKEFEDDPDITKLATPFCLMLLQPSDKESQKFQKVVFHNINSKSIPLTPEENLKVILDDEENFTDNELKNNTSSFGWHYYAARVVSKEINEKTLKITLPHLYNSFISKDDANISYRSILAEIFNFLLLKAIIKKTNVSIDNVKNALYDVNDFFSHNEELKNIKHSGFLIAFLYFSLKKEKPNRLESFANWMLRNHLYNISNVDAESIVLIYSNISEVRKKQIFVSMQFGDKKTEAHFRNIKAAIDEVNTEKNEKLKFRPIRIDQFNPGYSYEVTNEILKAINESGYLIADLTYGNKNVYQEVGYIMGYNASFKLNPENILLVMRKLPDKTFTNEIGFNLRHYQVKSFDEVDELKEIVKESIIKYYNL
jgi:hypothetical protein